MLLFIHFRIGIDEGEDCIVIINNMEPIGMS